MPQAFSSSAGVTLRPSSRVVLSSTSSGSSPHERACSASASARSSSTGPWMRTIMFLLRKPILTDQHPVPCDRSRPA